MATLYTVDGKIVEVSPAKNKFSLKELQSYVDGYIEIVPLANNVLLVVNEEGLLQNLPFNKSAMYHITNDYGIWVPTLVGDVLMISKSEVQWK